MVSQVFYSERKKPGLVEALSGEVDWKSCIYDTEQENLNVLPTGRRCERPLELISGEQFQSLVNELLTHYDRIIFDTPPVLAVSDTHVIAEYTDCIMLVIKSFKTGRKNVERAVQSFEDFERKPRGVILNSLPAGKKSYYYYYSGQYYGSYGSYGEDEQKERKQQKKKSKKKDKPKKKAHAQDQLKNPESDKNTDTVDKQDQGEKDVY
jgi:capsular exopolysaccharide synthesis family protein